MGSAAALSGTVRHGQKDQEVSRAIEAMNANGDLNRLKSQFAKFLSLKATVFDLDKKAEELGL